MATKKKPTEPTDQAPSSASHGEGSPPASAPALADTEPAPSVPVQPVDPAALDTQREQIAAIVGEAALDVVRERLGVTGVLIDGPLPELGESDAAADTGEAFERRAAVQLLQEAIAAVYGADVAANYIAARRDDLAATSVPEILEAAATVPPADSPEAELIRDDAATVVVGAPTVAGELPSGIPDMLPPVEVRNAQRPPALKVTVPEQGFEVRPRDDAPSYYRVMVGKSLMIDGMMASFQSGQIIDDRSYSLEWLRKQGIEVVPCEAPEPYSNSL